MFDFVSTINIYFIISSLNYIYFIATQVVSLLGRSSS